MTTLIGLAWHLMPMWVRLGVPVALVVWYLVDAALAERPQK